MMKKALLFISLLLVQTEAANKQHIKVTEEKNGIRLACENGEKVYSQAGEEVQEVLREEEGSSGIYYCGHETDQPRHKILLKLRTCENCITLDEVTASAVVIANVMATVLIGVAVHLIAAQSGSPPASGKKASDRRGLIPNESNPNSHYQELRPRDRDVYSIATRRL